eukprot:358582-Chlamydomonas_euryale.AAC.13
MRVRRSLCQFRGAGVRIRGQKRPESGCGFHMAGNLANNEEGIPGITAHKMRIGAARKPSMLLRHACMQPQRAYMQVVRGLCIALALADWGAANQLRVEALLSGNLPAAFTRAAHGASRQ